MQREIIATENSLKSLNDKAEESGNKLDLLGTKADKMNKIMVTDTRPPGMVWAAVL